MMQQSLPFVCIIVLNNEIYSFYWLSLCHKGAKTVTEQQYQPREARSSMYAI